MEQQARIIDMFESIAHSYDTANRVLSLGVDKKWRKEACALTLKCLDSAGALQMCGGLSIADVACGTGDMMINWLQSTDVARITGIDPSQNMLSLARKKCDSFDNAHIDFITAEAKDLSSITSDSIDIVSIAYGLRNVVEIDVALREFARVLKKGGMLVILEFTKKDKQNLADKLALFYTTKILPIFGGLISKNYAAYKYLPNSIEHFITLESLEKKLLGIGFDTKIKKRYTANLCSLLIAQKV